MDLSFLKGLGLTITLDAALEHFTTFRLGGTCPALIECADAALMRTTISLLRGIIFRFWSWALAPTSWPRTKASP